MSAFFIGFRRINRNSAHNLGLLDTCGNSSIGLWEVFEIELFGCGVILFAKALQET